MVPLCSSGKGKTTWGIDVDDEMTISPASPPRSAAGGWPTNRSPKRRNKTSPFPTTCKPRVPTERAVYHAIPAAAGP
jgi:hypothetical protein